MHLTVYTFCDMSSSPSDPSGADILFYLATDDSIFLKDYLPILVYTYLVLYKPIVSYPVIPNTRDLYSSPPYRYIYLVSRSLTSNRETVKVPKVVFVADSTTSYDDDSHHVNDLENPDSSGSSSSM